LLHFSGISGTGHGLWTFRRHHGQYRIKRISLPPQYLHLPW
jgi:hypothetical protein